MDMHECAARIFTQTVLVLQVRQDLDILCKKALIICISVFGRDGTEFKINSYATTLHLVFTARGVFSNYASPDSSHSPKPIRNRLKNFSYLSVDYNNDYLRYLIKKH